MDQSSGGWSDDDFDDPFRSVDGSSTRKKDAVVPDSGSDVGGYAPEPHRHQLADSSPSQIMNNVANPHASLGVPGGDLDHDTSHESSPHARRTSLPSSTPQSQQSAADDNDRLALVGVINEDNSIRVQVLATPPPKPPRLPSIVPPSSLSLLSAVPGSSSTAGSNYHATRSPSMHGSRTRSPAAAAATVTQPLTDEETMAKLQEASVQKREERAELVHSLTTKIALVTSQVVHENLQRETSIRNLHSRLGQAIEESMDRMALQQDVLHNHVERMHQLEVTLTRMDAHMTHSLHAETCQHLQELLGSLQERADAAASAHRSHAESCLSTDAAAFRTMDRMAGDTRKRWLEERSSRLAAIELAGYQVQERDWDPNAARQYLEHIQDLRNHIRDERIERMRNDAAVKDQIVRATSSLKRAMLHLAVDPPMDGIDTSILEGDDEEGEADGQQESIALVDYLGV